MGTMSEETRRRVVEIARSAGFEIELKDGQRDLYVKNLTLRCPRSRHRIYIRKDGSVIDNAGRVRFFQVAVHPQVYDPVLEQPQRGVKGMINSRKGRNLFSSSNYQGFPYYPENNEPCGMCYQADNEQALTWLLGALAGRNALSPSSDPGPEARQTSRPISAEWALPSALLPVRTIPEALAPVSDNGRGGITHALVIASPHIEHILAGEKTWEMRSRHTQMRGSVGLIRKGSGTVVGVVDIINSLGPLNLETLLAHQDRHRIDPQRLQDPQVARWNIAWQLERVRPLEQPIPYMHPSGAQSWVRLSEDVQRQLQAVVEEKTAGE